MRYLWRNGRFEDSDGKPMAIPARNGISMPMVVSDIPEYRSPINGQLISSRSARREDMKRNNCLDARDFSSPTDGKFKNERFSTKHGLPLSEEAR